LEKENRQLDREIHTLLGTLNYMKQEIADLKKQNADLKKENIVFKIN